MRIRLTVITAVAVSLCVVTSAVVYTLSAAGAQTSTPVRFKAAKLIVETNATDGDAGLQVFLDHEPWRSISIARPDGQRIVDVETRGVLRDYGLTELFSESSEPPFTEFPLSEFKNLFPEGRYTFTGETIDGVKMQSRVRLTHNFPPGPQIKSPQDGSTVPIDDVVVRWEPVDEAGVVAYQVVVTKETAPERVLTADVDADVSAFRVPPEFLEAATEYKAEVLAIEQGGNQTLTEVTFETS